MNARTSGPTSFASSSRDLPICPRIEVCLSICAAAKSGLSISIDSAFQRGHVVND